MSIISVELTNHENIRIIVQTQNHCMSEISIQRAKVDKGKAFYTLLKKRSEALLIRNSTKVFTTPIPT